MPNHSTSSIVFSGHGDDVKKLMDFMRSEDCTFDFNNVIPMPKGIFKGSLGQKEEAEHGRRNWYDWSSRHWGTKWNAYSIDVQDLNIISFDTAWSAPYPVFRELAHLFPSVGIEIEITNEGEEGIETLIYNGVE